MNYPVVSVLFLSVVCLTWYGMANQSETIEDPIERIMRENQVMNPGNPEDLKNFDKFLAEREKGQIGWKEWIVSFAVNGFYGLVAQLYRISGVLVVVALAYAGYTKVSPNKPKKEVKNAPKPLKISKKLLKEIKQQQEQNKKIREVQNGAEQSEELPILA